MSRIATRSYNQIWWRKSSCVQKRKQSGFIERIYIATILYEILHSADNFILSTISDGENKSHFCSVLCFFGSMIEDFYNMWWKDIRISHPFKFNAFFKKPWEEILNAFYEQIIEICEFFRTSIFYIFLGKCPKTAVFYFLIIAKFYYFFETDSSFLVTEKCLNGMLFCPSTISVHDKSEVHEQKKLKSKLFQFYDFIAFK